jgi:hypothetical protein
MHEVVYSYDEKDQEIKGMKGRKFRSFQDAARVLKPGQTMTLRLGSGDYKGWYKAVGIDINEKGNGFWVQRRASMEY